MELQFEKIANENLVAKGVAAEKAKAKEDGARLIWEGQKRFP